MYATKIWVDNDKWCHDNEDKDTQHNDTQHNNTQNNKTPQKNDSQDHRVNVIRHKLFYCYAAAF